MLNVQITNKNAIYVNDTRITNRSTKWGVHNTVAEFQARTPREVLQGVVAQGFPNLLSLVDYEPYRSIARSALEEAVQA